MPTSLVASTAMFSMSPRWCEFTELKSFVHSPSSASFSSGQTLIWSVNILTDPPPTGHKRFSHLHSTWNQFDRKPNRWLQSPELPEATEEFLSLSFLGTCNKRLMTTMLCFLRVCEWKELGSESWRLNREPYHFTTFNGINNIESDFWEWSANNRRFNYHMYTNLSELHH